MTAAQQQGGEPVGADAPAGRPAHEISIGPTQAFDAKGIARTVWALRCSCGHTGKAIDQAGIGREARLHALELQVLEMGGMLAAAFAALEGMSAAMQQHGIVPPVEPDAPMPEPPTEPVG